MRFLKNIIICGAAICLLSNNVNAVDNAYANQHQQQQQQQVMAPKCQDIRVVAASTTYTGDICSNEAINIGAHATVVGNVKSTHAVYLGAYSVVTGSVTSDCEDIITGPGSKIGGSTNAPTEPSDDTPQQTESPTTDRVTEAPKTGKPTNNGETTSKPITEAPPKSTATINTVTQKPESTATIPPTHTDSGISVKPTENGGNTGTTKKPCVDITNVVASTTFNGDICSHAAFTSGADSIIYGNINAVADITLGANSIVYGQVNAGGDLTMGNNAQVTGNCVSGSHVMNMGTGAKYNTNQSSSLIMKLKQKIQSESDQN